MAPLWDDYFSLAGTNNNVFVAILGNAPNREFVVEWRDVRYYLCRGTDKSGVTFQVVFFEKNSDVLFNYADTTVGSTCSWANEGSSATVGIQVANDTGTLHSYDSPGMTSKQSMLWKLAR